ncbi:MAG: hypothetical protein M0R03_22980 [Novosphingobium sp.]|nr:hypothetical protein [Novosphingobium sp.]
MNADKIDIYITSGATYCFAISYTILTGDVVASTTQSPAVMTSICKAINDGYIVSQIATGESGYNYYGLTTSKGDWWMIIREKTDFTDVGYKMNKENRQSFVVGWANRATLNYSREFPLK